MNKKYLISFVFSLLLISCADDRGTTLSCLGPTTTGCQSLSDTYEESIDKNVTSSLTSVIQIQRDSPQKTEPHLEPASLLRLWIAPWEDDLGDLHDQQFIYLVLQPSRWVIDNSKVMQSPKEQ